MSTTSTPKNNSDVRPIRCGVSILPHKVVDDAENFTYIFFTEPRVGYRVLKGEGHGAEELWAGMMAGAWCCNLAERKPANG